MSRDFCPESLSLLEPVTSSGELLFYSPRVGTRYNAEPQHTMLASDEIGELRSISKYHKTLKLTPYDPVNPRIIYDEGCNICKRRLISYQRIENKVFYVCLCGNQWTQG
ncbi:MAG: hypothetical protein QW303_03190 [Nitrososphaerota archaeon]